VSSDLSHYLDYHAARRIDADTCRAIEGLRWEEVGEDQACGRIGVNGLLEAARRRGLRARTVDLRNSGDTAGPRDEVVGYGAWVFEEAEARGTATGVLH
jgi:AmmeMemoRadiSam system protein B